VITSLSSSARIKGWLLGFLGIEIWWGDDV
jgi:hypothetical protein